MADESSVKIQLQVAGQNEITALKASLDSVTAAINSMREAVAQSRRVSQEERAARTEEIRVAKEAAAAKREEEKARRDADAAAAKEAAAAAKRIADEEAERAQVQELTKKFNEQNLTLKEAQRLKSLLNKEHQASTNIFQQETPAAKALTDQIARINDLQAQNRISTRAGHEEYFKLGTELRAKLNPAMMSFSQIIQDAPYGIRGIGNNIEFLTQQMTMLSAQGIGIRAMLQGMIASLSGPMGILLGVSVVTSLATVFGDKLFGDVEKAEKKIDELRDTLLEMSKDLSAIGEGQYFDRLSEKAYEVSKIKPESGSFLDTLWSIVKGAGIDTGIPLAIDFYSNKLPNSIRESITGVKYAGSFKEEDLQNANVEYVKNLRSQDELLSDSLKKQEDRYKVQNNSNKLTVEQLRALADEALQNARATHFEETKNKLLLQRIDYLAQIKSIIEKQTEKEFEERKSIAKLQYEAGEKTREQYMSFLNSEMRLAQTEKERLELLKEYNSQLSHYHVDRLGSLVPTMDESGALGTAAQDNKKKYLTGAQGLSPETQRAVDSAGEASKYLNDHLDEASRKTESLRQSFSSAMNASANAINEGIGKAFESTFGEANSLLEIFLKNLVSAIGTNVFQEIIGGLFSFLPGGSVLSGIGSILGFADGGWIPEPVVGVGRSGARYMFGEKGPEYVHSNSSLSRMMTERPARSADYSVSRQVSQLTSALMNGHFKIRGTDLVYVSEKAQTQLAGYRG